LTEPRKLRSLEREAARLKAKELHRKHERGTKARRFGLQISVITGIVALIGIIVTVVVVGDSAVVQKPSDYLIANNIRVGANLEGYTASHTPTPTPTAGVTIPANPPHIVIVQDLACFACKTFETANEAQLRKWVSTGAVTIEYRPISFLDEKGASANDYSKRAGNAVYCVANYAPDKVFDYNSFLYNNQPEESTTSYGPDDNQLLASMPALGITLTEDLKNCVKTHRFVSWIKELTNKSYLGGALVPGYKVPFTGTPTVIVNGENWTTEENWSSGAVMSPAAFAAFVQKFLTK
jgi:protein-disulfide isomerase